MEEEFEVSSGWHRGIILAPSGSGKSHAVRHSGPLLDKGIRLTDGDSVIGNDPVAKWPDEKDGVFWYDYMTDDQLTEFTRVQAEAIVQTARDMRGVIVFAPAVLDDFIVAVQVLDEDMPIVVLAPDPGKLFRNAQRRRLLTSRRPVYPSLDKATEAVKNFANSAIHLRLPIARSFAHAAEMFAGYAAVSMGEPVIFEPVVEDLAVVEGEQTITVRWPLDVDAWEENHEGETDEYVVPVLGTVELDTLFTAQPSFTTVGDTTYGDPTGRSLSLDQIQERAGFVPTEAISSPTASSPDIEEEVMAQEEDISVESPNPGPLGNQLSP
jgi:hypothetical protein